MFSVIVVSLLFLGCAKDPMKIASKRLYASHNCLAGLQENLEPLCKNLQVHQIAWNDILIRCHKKEEHRTSFWDNYIFRVSDPATKYSISNQKIIDSHTICVDGGSRIEAYSPKEKIIIDKIK